jgi:tartrate dehydratase beta subunit/fumarate hydratase class I family protein
MPSDCEKLEHETLSQLADRLQPGPTSTHQFNVANDKLLEAAKRLAEINKATERGSVLRMIALVLVLVLAYGGAALLLHYIGVFNSPLANAVFDIH